ncbi:hypothetical protein JCM30471_05520 [Desulfuromonas carbonis]|uniref:hypothetical protein n=1 Tax=Desulfuromonas sp. DDH964 TaxID=1823759 RepID=UPI00078B6378|nr:hypothetical protein [Desulfuromonas sp. DDH964]AMV72051.1 hypothetical protein DBW_1693 [Desulfuromonas sp. DDH964]
MPSSLPTDLPLSEAFPESVFSITTLEDEIRADRFCHQLLLRFASDLVAAGDFDSAAAGALAHGADYFLREFVIGDRRENILQLQPQRLRQFAGNWYIVRNLEPNLKELCAILEGVTVFYHYLAEQGLVPPTLATEMQNQARDVEFFRGRIDAFWAIDNDGYSRWDRACPVGD